MDRAARLGVILSIQDMGWYGGCDTICAIQLQSP